MRRITVVILLAAGLMLGACGDGEPVTCNADADCNDSEACERNLCKVCEALCVTSDDCTAPYACDDYGNGCTLCR